VATYNWMTGPSEDLNRTHYLKAMALAVMARAGGGGVGAVKAELAQIEPQYLLQYPTEINPDLAWAKRRMDRLAAAA
jgi:hypothetical protein